MQLAPCVRPGVYKPRYQGSKLIVFLLGARVRINIVLGRTPRPLLVFSFFSLCLTFL